MTAISSIVNPAVSGEAEISVFYSSSTQNVALQRMSGNANPDPDQIFDASTSPTSQEGPLYIPSAMASVFYQNMNAIYGFTGLRPGSPGSKDFNNISLISPVYQPLHVQVEVFNTGLAACNDVNGLSAVYFIQGGDPNSLTVYLYDLTIGGPQPLGFTTSVVVSGSQLTAYNDGFATNIIFQGINKSDKTPALFETDNITGELRHIEGADNCAPSTPMAVVYDPQRQVAFLYFCNPGQELQRVCKIRGRWQASHEVQPTNPVAPGSSLSATLANGIKHIFYVPIGDSQIRHVRDMAPPAMGKGREAERPCH